MLSIFGFFKVMVYALVSKCQLCRSTGKGLWAYAVVFLPGDGEATGFGECL